MIEIATCSFGEYRPEMGAAVRTSIGAPKWFSHPYLTWDRVFPKRYWLHLPYDAYKPKYLDMLEAVGEATLRDDIAALVEMHARRNSGEVPERLTLLCYEKLSKGPDNWCHRTMLANWLIQNLQVPVVELGALPAEPIDPPPTLF